MVVTIVCRDTINCKDTIVLCNGAQEYENGCVISQYLNVLHCGNISRRDKFQISFFMTITTVVSNKLQTWVGNISITQVWVVLSAALFLFFSMITSLAGSRWCY